METLRQAIAPTSIVQFIASFIGSGINGNRAVRKFTRKTGTKIASFIGSGINGNSKIADSPFL